MHHPERMELLSAIPPRAFGRSAAAKSHSHKMDVTATIVGKVGRGLAPRSPGSDDDIRGFRYARVWTSHVSSTATHCADRLPTVPRPLSPIHELLPRILVHQMVPAGLTGSLSHHQLLPTKGKSSPSLTIPALLGSSQPMTPPTTCVDAMWLYPSPPPSWPGGYGQVR